MANEALLSIYEYICSFASKNPRWRIIVEHKKKSIDKSTHLEDFSIFHFNLVSTGAGFYNLLDEGLFKPGFNRKSEPTARDLDNGLLFTDPILYRDTIAFRESKSGPALATITFDKQGFHISEIDNKKLDNLLLRSDSAGPSVLEAFCEQINNALLQQQAAIGPVV